MMKKKITFLLAAVFTLAGYAEAVGENTYAQISKETAKEMIARSTMAASLWT